MDLHHQYVVKLSNGAYVAKTEDGISTTRDEKQAYGSWSRHLAARTYDEFVGQCWNATMGKPPGFEVVKVHRPQKIHHPW